MDDVRMDVTEQQLDKLAGRLAEVERKADEIIKVLSKREVANRIGLTNAQIHDLAATFLTVQTAEMRHYTQRAKNLRQAEKDRLFNRLRSEPGLAYPEARQELAALEAGRKRRSRKTVLSNRERLARR